MLLEPSKLNEPINMSTEMLRISYFLEALAVIKKCLNNSANIELVKIFKKAKDKNDIWMLIHAIEDLYSIKLSGSEKIKLNKLFI